MRPRRDESIEDLEVEQHLDRVNACNGEFQAGKKPRPKTR